MSPSLTLEQAAARIGQYVWTETFLFEVLGGWIATVPEPDVKVMLARHCREHAWHAALWEDRQPDLRGLLRTAQRVPPNDTFKACVEVMSEPEAPWLTIEKLAGAYRVLLPHLVETYTAHRATTSARPTPPTARALDLILADDTAQLREAEAVLALLDGARRSRESGRGQPATQPPAGVLRRPGRGRG